MALNEELKRQGDFLFRYRSYFPLILLLFGLAMIAYMAWTGSGTDKPRIQELMKDAAIFVGMAGLLVRVVTVGYTPKNTSGRNTAGGQVADTLNTKGIYSIVRNPLYLGNYLMWLGVAMLTQNIWFILVFSLVFWIYYERIVYAEEAFLREKFGKVYLDWASKTPPFLPRSLKLEKAEFPFSWKKVLKKEKNGLFALFLVFYLLELVRVYIGEGSWIISETWLLYGMILSGLIYLVLKIIKRTTRLLNEEGR